MRQKSVQASAPLSGFHGSLQLKKTGQGMLVALVALLLLLPGQANATHFRFGLVTAARLSETLTTVTYRLNVSLSWRLGTAPASIPFIISGGNSGTVTVAMTTVTDPTGTYDNSTGTTTVTLNKASTLTKIEFTGFTKLTTIANNANSNWDVYIILNTRAGGSSPLSTLPAIVNMPSGVAATSYTLPATDPDAGSTLTYGTPAFTGALAGEGEPTGFSINSSTGMMTYNTTGATTGQLYNALVTVTDNDSNTIMLDFLINMVGVSSPPQFDYAVTPANGHIFNLVVGQTLSFPVSATNPGSGTTVNMSVSGLPSYITTANFSPTFPATGNPSTTNFSWTPAAPQLGTVLILNFIATNNFGIQATSAVEIRVNPEPAPVYMSSTPAEGSIRSILAGTAFTDTITAQSSIGSNVSFSYAFVPTGASISPAMPTTGSNPAQVVFNWTPPPADFGQHHMTFESIISARPSIVSPLHYDLIVDDLPVFASTPVTTATACATYTYSVVVTDADIPYGDTVNVVQDGPFPLWLTLTSTGNGKAVLSGTPTNADAGTYVISLAAEDLYHHNYSKVGQSFTMLVTPNYITGTPDICQGATSALAYSVPGGAWSSSNGNASVDPATGVVTGTAAGTSTISYTLSGCVTTSPFLVRGLPAVSGITGTTKVCMGLTSTLANAVTGGVWSSSDPAVATIGASSGTYYGITAGTSTISYSVTDALGCSNSASTVVTIDPIFSIISASGANGTILPSGTANICSGDPASYNITPNTGYHVLDVLVDGVSVGALTSYLFSSVSAPHSVNATFAPDCVGPSISCAGDMTVSADPGACTASVSYTLATATGTAPTITYTYASGTAFPVGTTMVVATATNTCGTDNCSFNITVADNQKPVITAPAAVTAHTDAGICAAASVALGTPATTDNCGVASVTNDATPPYAVGTTIVTWTVTDVNGNTATATQNVVVTDNELPTIIAPAAVTVTTDAGACSAATVYLGVPVTGDNCGVASVTNDATPPYAVGTTVVTWTVTDIHGNTATATQNVTVTDNELPTITAPSNVDMNGYCSPVAVSIGSPTTSDNCGVASVTNNAPALFPVGSTTVTWTVTDIHGNTNTATQTVTVSGSISVAGTVSNVACYGGASGSITTTVTGGTPAYHYIWSNGATTSGIASVPAGTYSVTVTDGHDCRAGGVYVVSQPTALSLAGAVATNIKCYGANNGTITTNVTGGTTAYSYAWSMGSTSANLTALAPGTYSVTVTDAHGCIVKGSYVVTQPATALTLSAVTTSAGCYGSTGTVTTTVSGGGAPYTYLWSNGATTANLTAGAGTYSVTVTDANGCKVTGGPYTITQPNTPFVFVTDIDNVNCHGGTGHIDADVSGGTAPYTYTWTTGGLGYHFYDDFYGPAGTYTVTVTDARGCRITAIYTITEPAALSVTATITNLTCNGAHNGVINTTVAGGTAPYTYCWSNGSHAADPTGLSAGCYNVTITDAHGCSICASYTVTQPSSIGLTAVTTNVSCNGDATGAINTTITGGTAPYTYHWSNGATTQDLTAIRAGTYVQTVTDANGCTKTCAYTVTQPTVLSISAIVTDATNCDGSKTGTINTTVSGGTCPYTYVWSNGKTTADIYSLASGTYTVTVTDAHGCHVTASWTVDCHHHGHKGDAAVTGSEDGPSEIKVYPNPTNGLFSIEIPVVYTTAEIQISDITGRVTDTKIITDNSGSAQQFSLAGMQQGFYFVKVKAGGNIYVSKLLKN